ncbi:acyltransferase [Methylosinus sp. C49]|uniref:acyltransferase family protein n=1 Tax=Methylosinus sp. C49 TaxID=2699395 RepID=UPI00137946C0|nr:acyltransferase [Methylosinus sp. C49]
MAAVVEKNAHLVAIQWLRAIAAAMVVLHHAGYYANSVREQYGAAHADFLGVSFWWFGIHIFFVVSGFIMIYTTRDFGSPGAWRKFLWRRLLRIAPLYWIVTTIAVVLLLIFPHSLDITGDRLAYVLKSYAFIPVLRSEGDLRPIVGQGWTLDTEMFFYAAFALATFLPRRLGVLALSGSFCLLVALGRNLTSASPILFTWTDGLLLEFLFGVYLGLAFEHGLRISNVMRLAAITFGLGLLALEMKGPTFLTSGIPAALIVGGATLGPALRETSAMRWLTYLGDASYSLYLTHTFIVRPLRNVWVVAIGDRAPADFLILAALFASIVFAVAAYRFVEKPITTYLHRRFAAWAEPPRESSAIALASK